MAEQRKAILANPMVQIAMVMTTFVATGLTGWMANTALEVKPLAGEVRKLQEDLKKAEAALDRMTAKTDRIVESRFSNRDAENMEARQAGRDARQDQRITRVENMLEAR